MKPNYSKYKFNTTELSSKNIINYCFGFRNVVIPTYNYDTRIFNLNHVRIIYKYIYICICIFNIGTICIIHEANYVFTYYSSTPDGRFVCEYIRFYITGNPKIII